MSRRRHIALAAAALVAAAASSATVAYVAALGPVPDGRDVEYSTVVLDREGRLLRPYPTWEGRWRLPVTVADVDPRLLDLLFAYEDRRFRSHLGVDPLAFAARRSGSSPPTAASCRAGRRSPCRSPACSSRASAT